MRDMTLRFKRDLCVSNKRNCASEKKKDCFVRNYQQCFYSEGVNIKIAIALANTLLLSNKISDKRKVDEFNNDILYSPTNKGSNSWMINAIQSVSLIIYISRLKRYTRDSTVEDRKRELAKFPIKILVQC